MILTIYFTGIILMVSSVKILLIPYLCFKKRFIKYRRIKKFLALLLLIYKVPLMGWQKMYSFSGYEKNGYQKFLLTGLTISTLNVKL